MRIVYYYLAWETADGCFSFYLYSWPRQEKAVFSASFLFPLFLFFDLWGKKGRPYIYIYKHLSAHTQKNNNNNNINKGAQNNGDTRIEKRPSESIQHGTYV
jgi:hypothetical protein